jgi:hypothetical protein
VIITSLRLKGTKLPEILSELKDMYGQDSCNETDMKYWPHQLTIGRTNPQNEHTGRRSPVDNSDAQTFAMLATKPFSSMNSTAEAIEHPSSIIHVHMVQRLQVVNRHH